MDPSPPSTGPFAGPLGPHLVRLVVPMLLGMVAIALVGIVDAFFIGKLGKEALAAFGLCFPAIMILQALMFGLAHGITASLARARGNRGGGELDGEDRLRARVAIGLAFCLSSLLGLVGALLAPAVFAKVAEPRVAELALAYYRPYMVALVCLAMPMSATASMRGFGETRSSASVMTFASLFNAGLDPVLMFGFGPIPPLGIAGASIATVVAYVFGGLLALRLLRRTLGGIPRDARTDIAARTAATEIVRIGGPAMVTQALGPVANGIVTGLCAGYGVDALAGLGVMQRVDMLVIIVAVATGAGLMPMVGHMAGSGALARAAEALRIARRFMVVWALGVGLLLNLAAAPLAALFTDAPAVASVVRLALLFAPIGYLGSGLNITAMSCFNAVGHPTLATKLAAIFAVLLLPLVGAAGSRVFGLPGVFGGVATASASAAVLGTYWLRIAGLAPSAPRRLARGA